MSTPNANEALHNLPYTISLESIGTEWRIHTAQPISRRLNERILARMDMFDKTYSRFRSDSLLRRVAEKAERFQFPDDSVKLITFYRELYDITTGSVTPMIGNTLEDAGYDASYSFIGKQQSPVPAWDEVMQWDYTTLATTRPVTLDFGAAGKGYLVDIIAGLLLGNEHVEFVIDASGDILHAGSSENIVGLEHPNDPSAIIGRMSVQNSSICASATNRRAWSRGMHHIFDPHTLQPVREVIATWVVANSAMVADGLATALFFVDPSVLEARYEFKYVRMHADNTLDYSQQINGELYI